MSGRKQIEPFGEAPRMRAPIEPVSLAHFPPLRPVAPRVAQLQGAIKLPPVPPGFEQHEQSRGAPLTQVIESEKGPWSINGKYGRQNAFRFPATLDADPIAIFSIDNQLGPPRPRMLHFFRDDREIPFDIFNADLYAQVTYGVGGVQNSFLCDWLQGGHVPLVCDSLRVEAVPYRVNQGAYNPPTQLQLLGCMLGAAGGGVTRPPTFTTQQVTLNNGNFAEFLIPDFARWVFPCSILEIPAISTDVVDFLSFGGQRLKRLSLDRNFSQLGSPIPGGTSEIIVINQSGAQRSYVLQFELGL